ncbi:dynein light chain 1, cytoplasmic-like [Magnolia sinica]|uniref:dynein light chain 1, cytoplasmic-like n=1 Tax=Magnolia sinica TaxID=86752 RepID=UPI002657DC89|nr:dynein light chain 1, cytoplasmic-like [Magnolia sinica]
MEKPGIAREGEKGKETKKTKEHSLYPPRRILASPASEVRLAAIAIGLNIRLRAADMPAGMQERAFRYTRTLLDAVGPSNRPNPTHIALGLKKEFDASYGPAWHCVVGKSFGSFLTHSPGGFLYFSLGSLSFLLFKTEVRPIFHSPP